MWTDIACIVFACVTANHLGLIGAVEGVIRHRLPIINCPKCLTFWSVVIYGCDGIATYGTAFKVVAVALVASYTAIWVELIEVCIDNLYMKLYDTQISTSDNDTAATGAHDDDTGSPVPEL